LSKSLYIQLNRVCHPDRFVNDSRQSVAESIFQEITENENNYSKLKELKSRAEIELEVKFKN
jgi:DNA-binding protein H-NS